MLLQKFKIQDKCQGFIEQFDTHDFDALKLSLDMGQFAIGGHISR